MIKNIVFDIGNVLVSYNPKKYLEEMAFDEVVSEDIFQAIFKSKYWPELDRGTVTEEEAVELFCKDAPKVAGEIKKVMEGWKDMLLPMPKTIQIFKELKEAGYKLFVLSNYHEKAFGKILKENDFFSLLDGKVVSYEINKIKPEREIYDHLLSTFGLKPEETLFIDDTVENLEGAKTLGIQTVLFTEASNLRKYLVDNSILA